MIATVAVVVVISITLATWVFVVNPLVQMTGSQTRDDGPTFYQAVSQVNGSVQKETGGPWSLFSMLGIAAQLPFSPNVIGYPLDNLTVNSCGALFNGLTLWNGSIPVFTGTFNSGTAPFWQFAFYSNTTKDVLVATDVLGAVHLFTPEPYPGVCSPWNSVPGPLAWSEALSHVSVDSPFAAAAAWNAVSANWPEPSEPFVQIMTLGPNIFDGMGYVTGGYLFAFERCGLEGVSGVQPHLYAAVNWSKSGQAVGSGPGGGNCAALSAFQGKPGENYDLLFSPFAERNISGASLYTGPFQVAFSFAANDTLTGFYDGWGLANWMTGWNLSTPSGSHLPLAAPACISWTPSIDDCSSNSSGWYAVVLSQSGEWINSYGRQPNGTPSWAEPVTALVSHQQIVIVVPSSWNLSGDVLRVNSTVPNTTVLGSLTL